ncbi:MAG: hypothetical protein WD359_02560 [Dehalococcoidia bacterium]
MPRIDDRWLDSIVYVYPSIASAEAGERVGGCGFLLGVPWESDQAKPSAERRQHTYVVTNSHNIREHKGLVIRFNTRDGRGDVLETVESQWEHHPDDDDLAVCLVDPPSEDYATNLVPVDACVNAFHVNMLGLGPGDNVFALSRFIGHDGEQRNAPIVRFGHLSMMPIEPVRHQRGYDVDAFLVEALSLSGHSGSPVFVYFSDDAFSKPALRSEIPLPTIRGPWLLGVDFAHMPSYAVLQDNEGDHPKGWNVEINSGLMAVSPGWKLQEWLKRPDMSAPRLIREQAE